MALNTNGTEKRRTSKSLRDDGASASNSANRDDAADASDTMDTEAIKRQIAPGLRSMYANVLNEDMPEDLLAMVEELAEQDEIDDLSSDGAAPEHDDHKQGGGDD